MTSLARESGHGHNTRGSIRTSKWCSHMQPWQKNGVQRVYVWPSSDVSKESR